MLKFDTEGDEDEVLVDIGEGGPERLMNTFVKAGRIGFEVEWEKFGSLMLPVEEDVKFLAEAYEELPFFVENGGEHTVYLGDGELEMLASRSAENVHVVCVYTPLLRRTLRKRTECDVSLGAYVGAWNRTIRGLIELASQLNAS
jgi:hypothetical protein